MAQLPIVLQLQQLATENVTDITELLRKALLVATKLDLKQFREWINQELNGYDSGDVPEYRRIHTDLKLINPYNGLIPFLIDDAKVMSQICIVPIKSSISGIVDILDESEKNGKSVLQMPIEPMLKMRLMEMVMNADGLQLEPVRIFGRGQAVAIIDTVRTKILDWSLQLESDGILGHNMTFSKDEKEKAHQNITYQTFNNFQGILGNVTGSTVTQNLQMTVKQGDFESLRGYLEANKVSPEDIESLKQALATDPKPTSKDSLGKVTSDWIGKMLIKATSKLWDIGIEKAAGLLIQGIAAYYGLQ